MDCLKCGTCCVAPDITSLRKPLGVACHHLDGSGLCSIYGTRPVVCSNYQPDELCLRIDAPTLEERVKRYLEMFDLTGKDDGT